MSMRLILIFSWKGYPEAVLSGRHSPVCYHREMVAAREVDVEQETDEMAVVVLAKAIVHPRTVMI